MSDLAMPVRSGSTATTGSTLCPMPSRRHRTALIALAALACVTVMPRQADAMLGFDPQIALDTDIMAGIEMFRSPFNVYGMPKVVDDIRQCYAYNDHPLWPNRFIRCNAEDDAAYLYTRDVLDPHGIAPPSYFVPLTFEYRQNAVLTTCELPPAERPAWIIHMLERVAKDAPFHPGSPLGMVP
jgi:hypothetical protein